MNSDDKAETVLDQFCLRRLYPHGRLFSETVQLTERRPSFKTELVAAPPGCCMFATGLITKDAAGRVCELTGCFCPPAAFKDSKVFITCSSRVAEQERAKR